MKTQSLAFTLVLHAGRNTRSWLRRACGIAATSAAPLRTGEPVFATTEIGSLVALAALVFLLRACLSGPPTPSGVYKDVLDFMAMRRWHSTVWVALVGLLVLPGAWFLHTDRELIFLWQIMGRRPLQQSGDFRDDLDRVVVLYQWALTAGRAPAFLAPHALTVETAEANPPMAAGASVLCGHGYRHCGRRHADASGMKERGIRRQCQDAV